MCGLEPRVREYATLGFAIQPLRGIHSRFTLADCVPNRVGDTPFLGAENIMPEPQHLEEDAGNPWQRPSRTVAYQNPWIVVYHDEVVRPDGQPGIYGLVHYRNRAVAIVALDAQDRVLLVGQFRYTLNLYSWEIPEGGAAA